MNQESFAESYERWLAGPLFRPWAEMTLDRLELRPGDRVLDIACATGIVARVARERLGNAGYIVGVDVSPDMVTLARAVSPGIQWREGNAIDLPLDDGERFDVVICQQGLQFFPDKPAAAAQMRRALAQGGRLAVATWRPDSEIPFIRELRHIAERQLGAIADRRHSFGDAGALEELLRNAGFHEIRVSTITRTMRLTDGAALLRLNTMALAGMSAVGKELDDEERKRVVEAIVSESAPVLLSYTDASDLVFELSTNLAVAKG